MKKKTLLGMSALALAFAAVAGAVSARGAVETKADDPVTVYFKDASWWRTANAAVQVWAAATEGGQNYNFTKVDGSVDLWKADIDVTAYETFYFKRVSPDYSEDWGAEAEVAVSGYTAAQPVFDISASTATWKPSKVEGTWVAYEEPVAPDYYVVGDFTEPAWGEVAANKLTPMGEESKVDGHTQYESGVLALHKDDELKVEGGGDWFPPSGGNYVIPADGNYKVYFVPEGNAEWDNGYFYVANQDEPGPIAVEYYVVGDFTDPAWAEVPANKLTAMGEESKIGGHTQYESGEIVLGAGAKVKVKGGENWYPAGVGNEHVIAEAGTYKFYFVPEGNSEWGEPYDDYFYAAKQVAPAVYKVSVGGVETTLNWNETAGEWQATGLNVTKDAVVTFTKDGAPIAVAAKEGEGNNVAVVSSALQIRQSANNVGIYLANGEAGYSVWVGGYVTPDVEIVDEFVATYITEQAKPSEVPADTPAAAALCKAKYDAAKAAFEALTKTQQDLFSMDERYAEARAAYAVWEAAQKTAEARNSNVIADNGSTIAIISIVSAGVLAVGAMAYFARKRKAN